MNSLETYLKELSEIRASGAGGKETSYYAPLAHSLNKIGKTPKPKIYFVINTNHLTGNLLKDLCTSG